MLLDITNYHNSNCTGKGYFSSSQISVCYKCTRKHSSRMCTARLSTIYVMMATTRCQFAGDEGWGSPSPVPPSDIPTSTPPSCMSPPGHSLSHPSEHNHSPLEKGPGTRHTHPHWKGPGTRHTPVNRHMPVKTLPSRNFICGR